IKGRHEKPNARAAAYCKILTRASSCDARAPLLSSARRPTAGKRSSIMLQAIRSKASSYVVKLLFALLTATFALWGIGDIFRNWGTDTTVAKVGSKEISADQVNQALRQQLDQLRSVLGNNIDMAQAKQLGLVNAALQQIISGYLVDLEVSRLGLAI